jgi:flagellar biosynthesis protein FlhF
VLRFHNIPEHFVSKISNHASRQEFVSLSALQHISANRNEKPLVRHALEKIMNEHFQFRPLEFNGHASRIMLVGPPGIGKTLTIAKLATQLSMENTKCAVFTTDNQRAGGIEQLQAFTDILESPLYVTPTPEELSGTIQALPDDTHVLVDTAGCNPYNSAEMKQLKELATQKGIEPIMVLPAGGDSSETIDIVEAFAALPIKRLLVTRADTTRRFGSIVSAAAAHKLAFCHVSTSSSIVNSLDPMNSGTLAQLLLRYQLQS